MTPTDYRDLSLIVRANGKPLAAFCARTDAELWTLRRSEEHPTISYEILDRKRPEIKATIITKGGYDDFANMARRA